MCPLTSHTDGPPQNSRSLLETLLFSILSPPSLPQKLPSLAPLLLAPPLDSPPTPRLPSSTKSFKLPMLVLMLLLRLLVLPPLLLAPPLSFVLLPPPAASLPRINRIRSSEVGGVRFVQGDASSADRSHLGGGRIETAEGDPGMLAALQLARGVSSRAAAVVVAVGMMAALHSLHQAAKKSMKDCMSAQTWSTVATIMVLLDSGKWVTWGGEGLGGNGKAPGHLWGVEGLGQQAPLSNLVTGVCKTRSPVPVDVSFHWHAWTTRWQQPYGMQ